MCKDQAGAYEESSKNVSSFIDFIGNFAGSGIGKSLHSKGQKAETRGDYEAAYEFYRQAYNQQPDSLKYRVPYERTRFLAAAAKVHRGQKLRDEGHFAEALALFQKAVEKDPSNDLAAQEVRRTQQMMQKAAPPPLVRVWVSPVWRRR